MKKEFNGFIKKHTSSLILILSLILLSFLLTILGIGCPFKYFFGVSCAGCGMTRAWIRLFQLDFAGAFSCHPLFLFPIPFLLIIYFKGYISQKLYYFLIMLIIALFFIVYLIRIINPMDSIVVFEPGDGFFIKKLIN